MSEANELADHKQRLGTMSARLAAAESEVRRLRRVIDAAQVASIIFNDLQQVHDVDVFDEDDDGVPCRVIRMSELEAIYAM